MAIEIVSYRLKSISPLLMNNPASMSGPSEGLTVKKKYDPAIEAKSKLYSLPSGVLYIKPLAVRSALLRACNGRRLGKVGARSVVAGAVFHTTETAELFDPSTKKPIKDYVVNSMRAVVNGSGITRHRPEIPSWASNIDFEVDTQFLPDIKVLTELLSVAGRICGIGDYRPEKSGSYGRFEVELLDNSVKAEKQGKKKTRSK